MINHEDFESGRVVWREVCELRPYKIPDGFIKCSKCSGSGKVIKIYKDPGPNEYLNCFECDGTGFVPAKVSVVREKEATK
jgi:hypothetical protein